MSIQVSLGLFTSCTA